jgi:putative transposase
MQRLLSLLSALAARLFRCRRDLLLENLALRQQLAVLKVRHPQPRFAASDKLFWVMLCRLWPGWKQALILVQPETVVGWHRTGFKLYWKWLSRHRTRAGRRCVSKELRELIFRMVAENLTWGAPRIHGELRMLGFDISERTVSRWMRKAPRSPELAKRWAAFLDNHREAIAAMDFFTVNSARYSLPPSPLDVHPIKSSSCRASFCSCPCWSIAITAGFVSRAAVQSSSSVRLAPTISGDRAIDHSVSSVLCSS